MRVVPPYRPLNRSLPRRLRWTRAHAPTRRHIPNVYRPAGRAIVRPAARVSLLHLAATLGVIVVLWGAGALFQTAYAGRIFPHITIDHVPVGAMTRAEALAALGDTEAARVNEPIYVQAGDKTWQVTPAQLGARYDITSAVDRALALAHSGPFVLGGWREALTIWQGANIPLSGRHDPAAVTRFLAHVARDVHVVPKGAVVGVQGDDVAILRPPLQGQRLDVPGATAALSAVVNTHDATDVTLPLQPIESALNDAQAQAALAHAHALLAAAPIQFLWTATFNQSWQLSRSGLLRLLTFTPRCTARSCHFDLGINVPKLAAAFNRGGVTAKVDRAPTPASYRLEVASYPRDSSVLVIQDSQGQAIDVARAAFDVLQQATAPPGSHTIFLPLMPLYPRFNMAAAEALNFNQDVGYSAASFSYGSDWARQNNLGVATNLISNTIVLPGHTFDLAAVAGPLTPRNGYIAGQNSIGPGDMTGVNGGVDQLASAVLAAAYDAGLAIVRRAFYPYLNRYTVPGYDAVVTYGKHGPDLVFRNTTDHPILVMTSNDNAGDVGVFIFNSQGYAPNHQRGAYASVSSPPQITLHQDGSVDTVITRDLTVKGRTTHSRLASHYASIDP